MKTTKRKYADIKTVQDLFISGGCKLVSTEFIHGKIPLDYICNCGQLAKITLNNFRYGKRCKTCGIKKRNKTRRTSFELVKQICNNKGLELLTTETEYYNISLPAKHINVKVKCGNGHEIERNVSNLRNYKNKFGKCIKCHYASNTGTGHFNWIKDRPPELRKQREYYHGEDLAWKRAVHNRDGWKCLVCNRGGQIAAHHLNGYNWDITNRYNVNNGVTLCEHHHKDFHKLYGKGNNTLKQFIEFLKQKSDTLASIANDVVARFT